MTTRQDMVATLDKVYPDLITKSRLLPGKVLVIAARKTLKVKRGGYNTFLNFLPAKYKKLSPSKLIVVWRNTVMYLKARAVVVTAKGLGLVEFVSAGDKRVRSSHKVLDGLILSTKHPLLNTLTNRNIIPPLEPNCRCQLVPVAPARAAKLVKKFGMKLFLTRKLPQGAAGFSYKGL